jgi:hypothetical protein
MLDDTIFEDTGGLVAETRVNNTITGSVTNNIYAGTEAAAHNLTASSETVDEGSGGVIVGGTTESDAVTFPVGVTIYGRYTQIDVYSGAVIAYIGE